MAIIDAHDPCRRAAAALIEASDLDLEVSGVFSHAGELIITRDTPDVILLGLDGPDDAGLVERVTAALPGSKILVLSSRDDGDAVVEAMFQGAAGFVPMRAEPDEILLALTRVAKGETTIHPLASGEGLVRAVQRLRGSESRSAAIGRLSPRELEVLTLLSDGLVAREIAQRLVLSIRTVERHLSAAYRKLDVHSRIDAVMKFRRLQEGA